MNFFTITLNNTFDFRNFRPHFPVKLIVRFIKYYICHIIYYILHITQKNSFIWSNKF